MTPRGRLTEAHRFRVGGAGPETADAIGDPVVITRYLYKPDASEGMTHFNDNRRLHLFVVERGVRPRRAADDRHALTNTRSTGRRTGRNWYS